MIDGWFSVIRMGSATFVSCSLIDLYILNFSVILEFLFFDPIMFHWKVFVVRRIMKYSYLYWMLIGKRRDSLQFTIYYVCSNLVFDWMMWVFIIFLKDFFFLRSSFGWRIVISIVFYRNWGWPYIKMFTVIVDWVALPTILRTVEITTKILYSHWSNAIIKIWRRICIAQPRTLVILWLIFRKLKKSH